MFFLQCMLAANSKYFVSVFIDEYCFLIAHVSGNACHWMPLQMDKKITKEYFKISLSYFTKYLMQNAYVEAKFMNVAHMNKIICEFI